MKIGIITDIHEDGIRLAQAIRQLEKQNCDILVCLGDMSGFDKRFYGYGYSRNLNYCLSVIRDNCRYVIPGNHDLFVLKKIPAWNHVFDFPDNWYMLPPERRQELSKGKVWNFEHDMPVSVDTSLLEWLNSLDEFFVLDEDGFRILFTHSLFPDPMGMLTRKPYRHSDFEPHLSILSEMNCDMGISGHMHPNGVFRIRRRDTVRGKFGHLEAGSDVLQLVCPCIAESNQDNGFAILDTATRTVEAIPLRTPNHPVFW